MSSIRQMPRFGKLESCSVPDAVAYEWAMESTEIHSNEAWGNSVTLVVADSDTYDDDLKKMEIDEIGKLNRAERNFILKHEAALVFEATDGGISVRWFKTEESARKRFDALEADYYGDDEDEETDDDDDTDDIEDEDEDED